MPIHFLEGLALFHMITGIRLDPIPNSFGKRGEKLKTRGILPLRTLIKAAAGHPDGEQLRAIVPGQTKKSD